MDLTIENVLMQVRVKLNENHVKLWLAPYYIEGVGSCENELEILAQNFSTDLGLTYDHCFIALKELQSHSIDKLNERNTFQETGIATIKVRIPNQQGGTALSTYKLKLCSLGADLKTMVANEISIEDERIKLIYQGKVLKDNITLLEQGIKNGLQLMAVVLYSNANEIDEEGKRIKLLEDTKADIHLLSSKNSSHNYMQLEDQAGNAIKLPAKEQKALIIAMTLHEKGRAALKNEDYALALVLLLEADNEFNNCNSQILTTVDNYALLNLDIAWCYLCLKSVNQLPQAEERLKKCEENFHRSYGQNLERLIALKGTTGNESALFMRLHLLQAIVLFYQNRREEAKNILLRAESELQALKVDDSSLCALLELGFSSAEARLGLRATNGNINAAAEYINRNREERVQSRHKAAIEKVRDEARKRLGKCADGKQYVEPNLLDMMIGMGFSKEISRVALQQTNNVISSSVQYIEEHPEILNIATTSDLKVTKSMVDNVVNFGFDPRMAKLALKKCKGNMEKAVEQLLTCGGIIEGEDDSSDDDENDQRTQKEQEAFTRISEGISMVDDDHLDLTLVQEEMFLKQYKELLQL